MLLSGKVDVWRRDDNSQVLLATLGPGDVFGEISLVLDEPTSASVTTTQQSTVLFLGREVFERLLKAVPAIGQYVRELGEERLMDTRLLLDEVYEDKGELTEFDPILS